MTETMWGCTADDYEEAATAICAAMNKHAQVHQAHGNSGYRAILSIESFHSRCLDLAQRITIERIDRKEVESDV